MEVLRGIKLVGEIVGGIDDAEGMTLRNQTFEGALVEDVDEAFVENHLVEFAEKGLTVISGYLLDAHRFTHSILRTTGLADFRDAHLGINHHLHLFLTQFMTIYGQCSFWLLGNTLHGGRIAEDVAIHEQELLAMYYLA